MFTRGYLIFQVGVQVVFIFLGLASYFQLPQLWLKLLEVGIGLPGTDPRAQQDWEHPMTHPISKARVSVKWIQLYTGWWFQTFFIFHNI